MVGDGSCPQGAFLNMESVAMQMKNSYTIAEKLEMIHTTYEGNTFRVHVRVICICLKKEISSGWTKK
jgi:hypothetical protein